MKFEKVDLFCPKCGKYSVFKDPSQYNCETGAEKHACKTCYHSWYMEEIDLEKDVFEPKEPVEGGFSVLSASVLESWSKWRDKQIKQYDVFKGMQWSDLEKISTITVNEPQKTPTCIVK